MKQLVIQDDENAIQLSNCSNNEATGNANQTDENAMQPSNGLGNEVTGNSSQTDENAIIKPSTSPNNTNNQKTAQLMLNTAENVNIDKSREGNQNDSENNIHSKNVTTDEPDEVANEGMHLSTRSNNSSEEMVLIPIKTIKTIKTIDESWNFLLHTF
ncbi:2470_t:CDS:2 [Racocetra fulgida]|uniref:2470_t:CDS:1 n=1 Tax=Racocetra fulgida TaxID=60492 RepID=A0A9N9JHL6_9GLOM|nr:2470_t:CDS:2 [Racocetra fulgida]